MESTDKGQRKPLKLSQPGKLELKKTVETGQVKQSFSHGRSKTVTVEVKRKRTYAPGAGGAMAEVVDKPTITLKPRTKKVAERRPEVRAPATKQKRSLTEGERAARIRALEDAQRAAEQAAKLAEADQTSEVLRKARESAERAEAEEKERLEAERESRRAEEETRRQAEEEAKMRAEDAAQRAAEAERRRRETEAAAPQSKAADESPSRDRGRGAKGAKAPARGGRGAADRRRGGKLTISEALDEEGGERRRSVAAFRRRQEREKQRARQAASGPAQKIVREVVVPESITVGELANRMAERGGEVMKTLMKMGVMATINQVIDQDTAELVIDEYGHKIKRVAAADVEIGLGGQPDDAATLEARAPVVTIMGHVDHGKTSLLDALRETDVVAGEAGGITQHIGAYQVTIGSGEKITFLDTPGHEAFTAMRQRGASVTDVVVLVVAADDGVQPQTAEAINHAKAAKVPLIVAINKIDRPEADPTRIKNELLSHEIVPEDLGGEVQCIEVSATEKTNLDKLEEAILLQAEVLELKANADRQASGSVVEAKLERGRGTVATLLVQRGTLKVGDIFIAGREWGRVRALIDDHGRQIQEAGPSMPVEVLGLNGTPLAGDDFAVVENEGRAREVTDYRQQLERDKSGATARTTLEQMFGSISAGVAAQLPLVVKADVQGSVEAIAGAVTKLGTDEVKPHILHTAVGGITESDISLAAASGGMIVGFNVRANPQARDQAKRDGVEIRYYSVIYDVVDDVKDLLSGKLAPKREETSLGRAEIREVFNVSKVGKVAGCMVLEGIVRRGSKARLLRDDVIVYDGGLSTLKRFKEDAREVRDGYECGMSLENYHDIQVGDIIESYEVREISRAL